MNTFLVAATAYCTALFGFAELSLAIDRHHEDSFGRGSSPGTQRPWMRARGAAGLLLSLWASLLVAGGAQGWVLWFGVMTAAAVPLLLVLTYAPKRTMLLVNVVCLGVIAAISVSELRGLLGR
jgi:hypothetical protein